MAGRQLAQAQQYETRRRLLDDVIAAYPAAVSTNQLNELAVLHGFAGQTALLQHRLDGAWTHYEAELQLREAAGDRRATGPAYHQLGAVAEKQRRFAEAEANYRKALAIFLEFGDQHRASITSAALDAMPRDNR
jgi:tetratricopeptide (TPR) repeat protein